MKKLGFMVTILVIIMVFFVGCSGSGGGSDMSLEQQERILSEIMLAFGESADEPDSETETYASFDFVVASGYDASFESYVGTPPRYIGEGSRIIAEMSLTGTTASEMESDDGPTPPFSISMELRAIDDRLPGGEVEVVINVSVTSDSMSVSARMNGDLIADELVEDLDLF